LKIIYRRKIKNLWILLQILSCRNPKDLWRLYWWS